jgi:hypothetical protein
MFATLQKLWKPKSSAQSEREKLNAFIDKAIQMPVTAHQYHFIAQHHGHEKFKDIIAILKRDCEFGHKMFDEIFMPIINLTIDFYQSLPASQQEHHFAAGGMIYHSLDAALRSFKIAPKYYRKIDFSPAYKDAEFQLAAFIVTLWHDLGKTKTDFEVVYNHHQWNPEVETLLEWGYENDIPHFTVDWNPDRKANQHEKFSNIIAAQLLERLPMVPPLVRDEVINALSDPSNHLLFRDIAKIADKRSVSHEAQQSGLPYDLPSRSRAFHQVLNKMASQFTPNDTPTMIWQSNVGVHLDKNIGMRYFIAELAKLGMDSIKLDPDVIAGQLGQLGILRGCSDENGLFKVGESITFNYAGSARTLSVFTFKKDFDFDQVRPIELIQYVSKTGEDLLVNYLPEANNNGHLTTGTTNTKKTTADSKMARDFRNTSLKKDRAPLSSLHASLERDIIGPKNKPLPQNAKVRINLDAPEAAQGNGEATKPNNEPNPQYDTEHSIRQFIHGNVAQDSTPSVTPEKKPPKERDNTANRKNNSNDTDNVSSKNQKDTVKDKIIKPTSKSKQKNEKVRVNSDAGQQQPVTNNSIKNDTEESLKNGPQKYRKQNLYSKPGKLIGVKGANPLELLNKTPLESDEAKPNVSDSSSNTKVRINIEQLTPSPVNNEDQQQTEDPNNRSDLRKASQPNKQTTKQGKSTQKKSPEKHVKKSINKNSPVTTIAKGSASSNTRNQPNQAKDLKLQGVFSQSAEQLKKEYTDKERVRHNREAAPSFEAKARQVTTISKVDQHDIFSRVVDEISKHGDRIIISNQPFELQKKPLLLAVASIKSEYGKSTNQILKAITIDGKVNGDTISPNVHFQRMYFRKKNLLSKDQKNGN